MPPAGPVSGNRAGAKTKELSGQGDIINPGGWVISSTQWWEKGAALPSHRKETNMTKGNPAVVGLAGFGLTTLVLQFHNLGWVDLVTLCESHKWI